MKEDQNKRKSFILMAVGVLTLLIVVAGATYAYFQAQTNGSEDFNINATAGTTDSLTFIMDDKDATDTGNYIIDNDSKLGTLDLTPITINATAENFKENAESIADGVKAKAVLKANSTTREANETYNVYLHIDTNELEYSSYKNGDGDVKLAPLSSEEKETYTEGIPELILTVKKNNVEVKDITGLESEYKEEIKIKYNDETGEQTKTISGYDITEKGGIIKIASNEPIAVTAPEDGIQPDPKEDEWEITLTFINLPTGQEMNTGKQVSGKVVIQKEEYVPTYQNNITKLLADDTKDGKTKTLFLHDGISTDSGSDQEAGDYSYRYSRATGSVNNYVCLDNQTVTGDAFISCETEDLYRIIGLFKNKYNDYEIKLIKAEPAISTQLGEDGAYKVDSENKYYWNTSKGIDSSSNTNLWRESNLNTINLNTNFITYLSTTEGRKAGIVEQIADHEWITVGNTYGNIASQPVTTAYKNEIKEPDGRTEGGYKEEIDKTYKAKIGLMYASDYGYAAYKEAWTRKLEYDNDNGYSNKDVTDNDWMYMNNGTDEWTITRAAGTSNIALDIGTNAGFVGYSGVYNDDSAVRPCFYLKSSTKIASGDGTETNPYRITW